MRVLVTGSAGFVGASVVEAARAAGHEPVEYDVVQGRDVLDGPALGDALTGCGAINHLAALLDGEAHRLREVNVDGTQSVLEAAARSGVRRVVFASSAAVTGVFAGEGAPAYLPLDEEHPCLPRSPYSISKLRAEEVCEAFADRVSVTALRAPGVWSRHTYRQIEEARERDPEFEWAPYWEYGAFVDRRDLARAFVAGLSADSPGFRVAFVASSDITTSGSTGRELAARLVPSAEWRGDESYEARAYQTLVRIDRAHEELGWTPEFTWRRHLSERRSPT